MQDFMGETLDCGLISLKFEGFFAIWAVRPTDPMARNGPQRGHAGWPRFGAWIVLKRCPV
jgi:hypothetical protein